MRKNYTSFICYFLFSLFLLFTSCNENKFEQENEKSEHEKGEMEYEKGEDKQDQMEKAEAFEFERTVDPKLGYVPRHHLIEAFEQVNAVKRITQEAEGAVTGITWSERGPSNVAGRTRAILIDKNDPSGNTIWAGSVGGGLWKATNFTTGAYQWTPINDLFPNLAVTCIAQNQTTPNVMYFGTGEGYGNSDALQGAGIWKSTDGGTTWSQLTITNVTSPSSTFSHIQKILLKQVGGVEYMFVATRNAGIQRSTDGGATFTKVNLLATSSRAADLDIAKNGDLYAGMGLSGSGDGIYRSTDNGDTWVKSVLGVPATGIGRVEIATAPGADSVIYASFQSSSNSRALGIYKSTNYGVNFTAVTNANAGQWASSQAWYDMIIAVDPDDANHVVIGGLDAYSTSDGGATWTAISSWFGGAPQYIHADHHEMKFYKTPTNQTYLYFGNDGGVFFTANATSNVAIPTVLEKNTGYNVTQFYHGAIGPVPGSNQLIAGAQDNGTQYFTAAGVNATAEVTGGDGAFSHIDDDNPNIQISQYVYNQYRVTNNNWASYTNVNLSSSAGRFINPSDYDSRTNTLYGAYSSSNYSLITNVGTTNNASTKSVTALGSQISAVCVSPNTVARVYFGASNGRIVRVDNANSASPVVTNITTTIPVAGYIAEIAVQEGDDNHIIYCISSFGTNSVWETKDGGTTWTSIEGNFTQDVPVRSIMFNPNSPTQAFIGTDIGVYSTDNINGTNTDWGETNNGLARVSVQHLEYRRGTGTLLAVTHGRGVYTSSSLERPAVYFANGNQLFTESSTNTINGCRKYTDVSVPVVLSSAPTGAVQVNISVNALSTAALGQDYDIMTPMPITFTSGTTQNVMIRIYDDAGLENTEIATIELSIVNPGTTNARKGAGYLDFITIIDNDKTPEVAGSQGVIFTENWESGVGTWFGFGGGTTAAPNVWGLTNTCSNTITNQTAGIYNQATNSCGYDNAKVTTAVIYQTINAEGRNNLSIEFDWKGVGEVGYDQGEVVFDTTASATPTWRVLSTANSLSGSDAVKHIIAALPAQLNNRSFRIGFRWTNDDNTGENPAFSVDNIKINCILPAPIQLAITSNALPSVYVGPFETVPFYDASGNVIATIKNNNDKTLGCVRIAVDRAGGNVNVPFWSNDASTFLCSKSYNITAPDAPATGVSYDVTLFYSSAEINTWKQGTGRTETDARIVKVSGHTISEVTPTTPFTSSVTVATSVTQSPYNVNDYAFTATFDSFSGFGLGAPNQSALPITLYDFKGELGNDRAILTWTTSSEFNNKGFYLERSFDGQNFASITFVNGYGTSAMPRSYSYSDLDLSNGILYYRLKQVDINGKFTHSKVVRLQSRGGSVRVLPNPFKSSITVLFGESVTTVEAQLITVSGSKLFNKKLTVNGQSSTMLDFSSLNLAKGNYILSLLYNGKVQQVKLTKN